MGFSGNGSIIVNTIDYGSVGHVDITLYSGTNGTGTDLGTFGLNYEPTAPGSTAYQGGWFEEDEFLSQQMASGTVTRSQAFNANLNKINSAVSYLKKQANANGQIGSEGYFLFGNNCVDGVSQILNMVGLPDNVATYMKPSTLPVYMYAFATAGQLYIPGLATNIQANPISMAVRTAGQLASWFLDGYITTAMSIVNADSADSSGNPVNITTGQITITVSPSNRTASVTYDNNGVQIYDQEGNPLSGNPSDLGFPSDLIDDAISALQDLQSAYPN